MDIAKYMKSYLELQPWKKNNTNQGPKKVFDVCT